MSKLSFLVDDFQGAKAIIPQIDGISLIRLVTEFETARGYTDPAGGYGGLIPDYFSYGPLGTYFAGRAGNQGESESNNEIYVLGCDCGEVGCWPLMAQVTDEGSSYIWSSFRQPHRSQRDYSGLGPFHFEREQYQAAVRTLAGLGEREE